MFYPQYPKRDAFSLNGVWQFKFSEDHMWSDERISEIEFDDLISVPSAFDAMPAYNGKRGVGFYKLTIKIPADRSAKITFNAVGMYAKIFIDGVKLKEQCAAYTPFDVDVPVSNSTERELVVMCGNRFDTSIYPLHEIFFDFYAYGGIFRDVELQFLPNGELIDEVKVDTLDFRNGEIKITIAPAVPGQQFSIKLDQKTAVSYAIDKNNSVILKIPDASPWSLDSPEMHTVTIDNGHDSMTVRFGVREIAVKNGKILLNGDPVKLLGYCRHEAHPQYGPALPLSQLLADLQLLRDSGCNFIRGSHYQQDPRFLDLCDEMGFLVFEESLGWGQSASHFTDSDFQQAQIAQTETMIKTSYNHPSVIIRGFLNEGETDNEASRECYEKLINLVRKQDPGRLVTYASNRELNDLFLELIDVVCFNIYPGWYADDKDNECPLEEVAQRIRSSISGLEERGIADKPFIISEIGAGAIYGWRDNICAHWSEEYQSELLAEVCNEVVGNDKVAGLALWQFCDCRTYRGFNALKRPRAFNNKGVLDEYRRPKLAYKTVRNIFKEYNLNENR